MVKQELIEALCDRTDFTRTQATHAVEGITQIIAEQLTKGNDVILRGLGTLKIVEAKEKVGRNIKNGTPLVIPAHNRIKFIPSKTIKESLTHEK